MKATKAGRITSGESTISENNGSAAHRHSNTGMWWKPTLIAGVVGLGTGVGLGIASAWSGSGYSTPYQVRGVARAAGYDGAANLMAGRQLFNQDASVMDRMIAGGEVLGSQGMYAGVPLVGAAVGQELYENRPSVAQASFTVMPRHSQAMLTTGMMAKSSVESGSGRFTGPYAPNWRAEM